MPRADVKRAMDRRPAPPPEPRPLLELLPLPARRMGGVVVLTLTLWLASFLALIR
jgi:hypothetical protein